MTEKEQPNVAAMLGIVAKQRLHFSSRRVAS
jgi:hypothetical protein